MMEFVHVAVAVFSLLSLGHSVPVTNCENLIQSLEIQGDQLLGRWTHIGESADITGYKVLLKALVDTAWWNITATSERDTLSYSLNQKTLRMCFTANASITLVNNTLTMVHPYPASAVLLNSGCPDCLVLYSQNIIGSTPFKVLQLLSRRTKVSAAELEEFRKQAECLSLPLPTILDSEKGFCPSPETKTIDLTSSLNSLGSNDLNLLEKLFQSEDQLRAFTDILSSTISKLQKN